MYCYTGPCHADACELEQDVEELRGPISRTFAVLCRSLFQPVVFGDCMLSMQCISMVMQSHVSITNFTGAISG